MQLKKSNGFSSTRYQQPFAMFMSYQNVDKHKPSKEFSNKRLLTSQNVKRCNKEDEKLSMVHKTVKSSQEFNLETSPNSKFCRSMKEIKQEKFHKKLLFRSGDSNDAHKNQIIRGLGFLTQDINSTPREYYDQNNSVDYTEYDFEAMVKSFTLNKITDFEKFLAKNSQQHKSKIKTIEKEKFDTKKNNIIDEK